MNSAEKHSVLVIGCGSIGERHLRCFVRTARAAVTACDAHGPTLENMKRKYGVKVESNWKEALSSAGYSAVVICTPAPLHVPLARYALEKNIHALIEKPLSHSLEGVEDLLRANKQSQAVSSVAYVLHVYPFLREAREFLQAGGIGPIRQAVFVSGQPFHRHRPGYDRTYYRDRASGGGAVQDALTHSANWIESVLGPTDSLLCDCAHQALPNVEVEDTVHVSARNGGVMVSYTLNQFQPPTESSIQFSSETGSVRIEIHKQRWGLWREGDTDWTWRETKVADRDAHFLEQAHAFLDQIEGQPSRLCTLEAAAQTLRFNLAALTAADAGQRVHCSHV